MITANGKSALEEVYKFCTVLSTRFNVGFVERPLYGGIRFLGEFYTRSGQLMTLTVDASPSQVIVKGYNATRRLVYSGQFTPQGLSKVTTLHNFMSKAIQS